MYDCFDCTPNKNHQTLKGPRESSPANLKDLADISDIPAEGQSMVSKAKASKLNRYYDKLKPYYQLDCKNDSTLIFESRFESGNLRRAVKVGEYEYHLFLKYDSNTKAHT